MFCFFNLLCNLQSTFLARVKILKMFANNFITQLCVHVINSDIVNNDSDDHQYSFKRKFHCSGIFLFVMVIGLSGVQ